MKECQCNAHGMSAAVTPSSRGRLDFSFNTGNCRAYLHCAYCSIRSAPLLPQITTVRYTPYLPLYRGPEFT